MRFRETFKNVQLMYAVGIDEETGENVIVVTVPSIGWSDFYFRLTNEEASSWKHDSHALDDLAERLAIDKGNRMYADRLIRG